MSAVSDYPNSYYAATANPAPDIPSLQGDLTVDVCIVGGGFTGIATALELVEKGYKVALLESERIGWGASGRNGGQLIVGMCEHDKVEALLGPEAGRAVWQMGVDCIDIVRQRVAQYDIDCDLKWGYFDAASKPRHMDSLREAKAEMEALGYPHPLEWVEQEQLASVVNSDSYIGGLVDRGSGHVHPLNLCLGEAEAAQQAGARLFELTKVDKVVPGEKPKVITSRGSVTADTLVLAGNAYLGNLHKPLVGKVLPAGSYIIATEPLGELADELIPQDMAICDQNIVLDYFRLSADKRLLFGGRCNYSGRDPKDITGSIRPRMETVFPQLRGVKVDYEWGGNIGISLNRIPQIGRLEGNILYAQGYSGHGVGTTHMAGRILAEAIAGNSEKLDIFDRIKHRKLPGGKWFGSPALALGMTYYRLLDML